VGRLNRTLFTKDEAPAHSHTLVGAVRRHYHILPSLCVSPNAAVFVAVMRRYSYAKGPASSPYSHSRISGSGTYANGGWQMANGKW